MLTKHELAQKPSIAAADTSFPIISHVPKYRTLLDICNYRPELQNRVETVIHVMKYVFLDSHLPVIVE